MTVKQVERNDIDQLWIPLECSEHIGCETGRRIPLTRDFLADVAIGSEALGAIG
jgi:hypothetical protein